MKKIGIITIHNSPNYGASLQSFALYKYIEQQGYECEIIDLHRPHDADFVPSTKYVPFRIRNVGMKSKIKNIVKKVLKRNRPVLFSSIAKGKFDHFNNQISLSRTYCGVDELYANPPLYDIYITGSDQLWNPTQSFCIEPYFLTFAPEGATKISYAASIGVSELTDKEKRYYNKWLSSYNAISVREMKAKKYLESFVNKEICRVADPTFLLDIDFWKSLSVCPKFNFSYILLFTLRHNPLVLNYALRLSRESGLPLISLGQIQPDVSDHSYIVEKNAGPQEFIGYIAGANLIITDSFHCSVFSLIMGANNFYSYIAPTNKRGSRIIDLLTTFKLENHVLTGELTLSYSRLMENPINQGSIIEIINSEKKHSQQFLNEQLISLDE